MPLTDYIESTETILDQTLARLRQHDGWTVSLFAGTSMTTLHRDLTTLQLPAILVIYNGGLRDNHPRRRLRLQLIIATPSSLPQPVHPTARALLDEAIARLDAYTYNDATWHYQADTPLDLATDTALHLLDFHVDLA